MRFDWDEGNVSKCQKHGIAISEIETVLGGDPLILDDPFVDEPRYRAIGTNQEGRMVYVVFTFREKDGEMMIRPISARYMHEKEVQRYEER